MYLADYLEQLAQSGEISDELYNPEARSRRTGQPVSAFKQALAAIGITFDRNGYAQQTGDVFFSDPNNRVLFPEFVRTTYADAAKNPISDEVTLDDLVLTRVPVNARDYRYGELDVEGDQDSDLEFGVIAEGAEIPVYKISDSQKAVTGAKYGGALRYTYERISRIRLAELQRHVEKLGRAQARRKVKAALATLLNGDGNSNPAVATPNVASWSLAAFVNVRLEAARVGAQPNIVIANDTELSNILAIPQVLDAAATTTAAGFRDTGTFPSILGMRPRMAPSGSVLQSVQTALFVDSALGLEEFYDPSLTLQESMRMINNQTEIVTISEFVGYAKVDRYAAFTKTRS
jgi:hypothetical protein